MKRIVTFLVAAWLLLLSGCSSGQKTLAAQDIDFVFSCKIDVTSPSGNLTCSFDRAGRQSAAIAVLSGNGSGLKWYWNGDGFRQTYFGLSAGSETCVLPEKSFASTLVKALDCAEQPGTLDSVGENAFSGSINGCAFTITADGNTGKIRTLSVPDRSLTVTFHDFSKPALQTLT
jgi:hypothetical protein